MAIMKGKPNRDKVAWGGGAEAITGNTRENTNDYISAAVGKFKHLYLYNDTDVSGAFGSLSGTVANLASLSGNYVLRAGDTMTGTLVVPNLTANTFTTAGFVQNNSSGVLSGGNSSRSNLIFSQSGSTVVGATAFFLKAGEVPLAVAHALPFPRACTITAASFLVNITAITGVTTFAIQTFKNGGLATQWDTNEAGTGNNISGSTVSAITTSYAAGDTMGLAVVAKGNKAPSITFDSCVIMAEVSYP